ncbi:efflux RND transporter periplasmic adaptor subunit [Peredibacter starrii]|uniref:Efflux RND transporter periplasmic adaptor subunit n=1 Tax=Peredibacter starrii TaxID=28202 RepID=A0AAX4HK13_9BACT|nr:efflux RND transporter periplasmic adaptor subunit [Peredibacter starrii]WPU63567.1 efflux RND transporter periplasmic adaptor subunit [Peredibacter starrii]
MKTRSFLGGIATPALIACLMFFASCKEEVHHKEDSTYSVTRPWKKTVEVHQQYVAQIRAYQHIEIRSFEKGYLQNIFVDEGQLIKKGDKMFQTMPLLVQAEYDKAKAEFEISNIEYKQTEKLAKQKVVSANELALTKAKFEKKKAVLDLAKAHLDFTTITAPFDGYMDRFKVRLGSLVEEGELLTTLSDISQLWVYFNVSERDYLNYMALKKTSGGPGTVKLILANGKEYDQPGKIDTIEADFDNETGNVAFRASFANPDSLLRHGETGNVVLTEKIENALVIPQKATFEVLDKKYVFVVDDKGVVQQREIEIDKEVPHLFIVKSGLSEQDTVLLEGLGKVNKGQTIKTKFQQVPEVVKSLELAAN